MFYVLTLLFNSQVIMNFAWKFFSKSKLPSRPECQCLIPVFPLSAETCLFPTFRDELYLFWLPQPAPIHGFRRHILLRDPRKSPHSECNRVQLIIKKFKIFFGGKTVATIYQIKTKFVNVFGFLYISKCSEFTIFGVKVNLKSVDPKCSYLACRILQISYYLPK